MPIYKIKIDIEKFINAEDDCQAFEVWENELIKNNTTLLTELIDCSEVTNANNE